MPKVSDAQKNLMGSHEWQEVQAKPELRHDDSDLSTQGIEPLRRLAISEIQPRDLYQNVVSRAESSNREYSLSSMESVSRSSNVYIYPLDLQPSSDMERILDQLFKAIVSDDMPLFRRILGDEKFSTNIFYIVFQRMKGIVYSPLEYAIHYKRFDMLELMLTSRHCTEEVFSYQVQREQVCHTILDYAIQCDQGKACELILRAPCFKSEHYLSEAHVSCMHYAIFYHAFNALDALLSYRDLNAVRQILARPCDKELRTPIMSFLIQYDEYARKSEACQNHSERIFHKMCTSSHRPTDFLQVQDAAQSSILHYLFEEKRSQLFQIIMHLPEFNERLLDISDENQDTPLILAMDDSEIGKRLLSLPNIESAVFLCRNIKGHTALHRAVSRNKLELVRLYMTPGVLKNLPEEIALIPDHEGRSILHTAIMNRHIDMIKILLTSRFQKDLLAFNNNSGQTPLMYAKDLMLKGSPKCNAEALQKKESAIEKAQEAIVRLEAEKLSTPVPVGHQERDILQSAISAKKAMIRLHQAQLKSLGAENLAYKKVMADIVLLIEAYEEASEKN